MHPQDIPFDPDRLAPGTPTRTFVDSHRHDDATTLALQGGKYPDVCMPLAISQIEGWQKARTKLPRWAAIEGIIFPPHLALEQCSSDVTAQYKARLARRLTDNGESCQGCFADITGGLGADFAALAPLFARAIYVERQQVLCQCARHNFPLLGLGGAEVWHADAVEALDRLPALDLLFIDPARRDSHGARTYAITDCTPDLLPLLPTLLQRAGHVMVKLSPMLDWHHTVECLQQTVEGCVEEVHIVAMGGECKELLLVLSQRHGDTPAILCCHNDAHDFRTTIGSETAQTATPTVADATEAAQAAWLCEPNAAIMKSGCFATLCQRYPVKALAANSHLFLAHEHVDAFPGRQWPVLGVTTLNKRQLRQALDGITRATIAVRNFPLSPEQLRRRLKLSDGGDIHIVASTTARREHILFVCGAKGSAT